MTPEWRLRDFRETLTHIDLIYLGFIGYPFTWTNKREVPHNTKLQLDRGVTNPKWCDAFPFHQIKHLTVRRSDHLAILASFSANPPTHHSTVNPPTHHSPANPPNRHPTTNPSTHHYSANPYTHTHPHHRPKQKLFRFEQVWLRSDDCQQVIRDSWDSEMDFLANMENCTVGLMNWSKASYPNIRKEIGRLNSELEKLNRLPFSAEVKAREREIAEIELGGYAG